MTAANPLLEVTRDADGFRLSGELDLSNVEELATIVSAQVREGNQLVFDCSSLSFIDSTGMAALLAICKGLGDSGRLTLRSVSPAISKAAHVLGLDRVHNLVVENGPRGIAATA